VPSASNANQSSRHAHIDRLFVSPPVAFRFLRTQLLRTIACRPPSCPRSSGLYNLSRLILPRRSMSLRLGLPPQHSCVLEAAPMLSWLRRFSTSADAFSIVVVDRYHAIRNSLASTLAFFRPTLCLPLHKGLYCCHHYDHLRVPWFGGSRRALPTSSRSSLNTALVQADAVEHPQSKDQVSVPLVLLPLANSPWKEDRKRFRKSGSTHRLDHSSASRDTSNPLIPAA
jgi:hypothetical protein